MKFKMERPGQVTEGQEVMVTELGGSNYNYMIEPAVAMSGCYTISQRLPVDHGIVKKIEENARGFYVTVEFDAPDVEA
jgi:hypothetical protein